MRLFQAADSEGQSSDPNEQSYAPEHDHYLPNQTDEVDAISQALDWLKPALGKLTFGGFVGYCSGIAAKKIGKAVAAAIGLGFIAIQGAVYTGYVDVDWAKVQDDVIKKVDTVC